MRSSSRRALGLAVLAVMAAAPSRALAQQPVQGFAVERFYPSAPGGGWLVMDELDLYGGLHGAMGLTFGYARNPLRVGDGTHRLAVVSDEAFMDVGASITYDRFRFYLNATSPLAIQGDSGTVRGYGFTGPSLDPGSNPDPISDVRLGADVRLFGERRAPFRLGAGAQLFIPNGNRSDYATDDTFRGMFRLLFAGDAHAFTYAGHVGVHVRPLDEAPAPGAPHGSEFLFGFAGGVRLPFGRRDDWSLIVGPEVFGATALRSFFGETGTAVEGLLTSRFEGPAVTGLLLRLRIGVGLGSQQLGAPESRVVCGVEIAPGRRAAPSEPR